MAAKNDRWWQTGGLGVLALGFAVWEYVDLTKFETEGGQRMLSRWVKMLYDLGGKWGVVGGFAVLGLLLIGFGVQEFLKKHRASGTAQNSA